MRNTSYTSWDIGGAHIKKAVLDNRARLIEADQRSCELWKGLDSLARVMQSMFTANDSTVQAVTMTGEMADLFETRKSGVEQIIDCIESRFPALDFRIYAGDRGLLDPQSARQAWADVSSRNWMVTAECVARHLDNAVLLDMGSTTLDIIPVMAGHLRCSGHDDASRLQHGELLYTGTYRTPVMAVCRTVPFAGEWVSVAAEHFASMGDVYRLTGELSGHEDMELTADGRDHSARSSAARLARMIGHDIEADEDLQDWIGLAGYIAGEHQHRIRQAVHRVLSRPEIRGSISLVLAGTGRTILEKCVRDTGLDVLRFDQLLDINDDMRAMASVCAPAVALAHVFFPDAA